MLEISQFVLNHEKYWLAWLRHGISLALNGNIDEAEYALNRAIDLAPNNIETNFYMASFLMQFKDRFEEARDYIEQALIISPDSNEALVMRQKLKL